jgi:hypothetical protein
MLGKSDREIVAEYWRKALRPDTIVQKSTQFQQTVGAYRHICSCGWTKETIMGRGEIGLHRAAIQEHEMVCPRTAHEGA